MLRPNKGKKTAIYFCFEEITEKLVSEGATGAEKIEGNNAPSTWFWLNEWAGLLKKS